MTREEAVRPLAMLKANWPFLDFSDQVTAELWMAAFEPYMEAEVRQGITEAIANISRTPTVADILEYVRAVHDGTRRAEAEAIRNRDDSETVNCWNCNDYGFVTIIYPNGDQAVRPCNCQTVDRIFGKQTLQDMRKPMPKWKQAALFGENEIPSQYELVRVSRVPIPTGETYKDAKGHELQRKRFGFVPYFPRGGREEIFMQYQKKERK